MASLSHRESGEQAGYGAGVGTEVGALSSGLGHRAGSGTLKAPLALRSPAGEAHSDITIGTLGTLKTNP